MRVEKEGLFCWHGAVCSDAVLVSGCGGFDMVRGRLGAFGAERPGVGGTDGR
jgi:hypothetical protein